MNSVPLKILVNPCSTLDYANYTYTAQICNSNKSTNHFQISDKIDQKYSQRRQALLEIDFFAVLC